MTIARRLFASAAFMGAVFAAERAAAQPAEGVRNIVLVHEGFVDGSGWRGVHSHSVYVSQPRAVAEIIGRAAQGAAR